MRTSIITHQSTARRRLGRLFREATHRADTSELTSLDDLQRLVRTEAISVPEAQGILTSLIHHQHQRQAQAA